MKFPQGTTADLLRLIAEYPLAWVVTHGAHGFDVTPLPLVAETNDAGELVALIGHCSRANQQVTDWVTDCRALLLFSGPQGYISPSMVSQKHWAPTWNFAVAAIAVDIELLPQETWSAVETLVTHAESDQPQPWAITDAGDRAGALMARIIGFRAHVRSIDARFKLGQDESAQSVSEIIAAVRDPSLKNWMQHFNSGRVTQNGASETPEEVTSA